MSDTISVSDFREVLSQLGFLDKVNRIETSFSPSATGAKPFGANVRMRGTNQMFYGFGDTEHEAVRVCIECLLKGKQYDV